VSALAALTSVSVLAQSAVDDLTSNFWLALLIKTVAVLGFFLVVPLVVGYMEHKVLAHMQGRLGPMEAGVYHGWAQLVADGVKFIQKEDVIPAAADRNVFSLAPAVAMIPYIVTLVVLPMGASVYALDLDVGVFFVLAMSSGLSPFLWCSSLPVLPSAIAHALQVTGGGSVSFSAGSRFSGCELTCDGYGSGLSAVISTPSRGHIAASTTPVIFSLWSC